MRVEPTHTPGVFQPKLKTEAQLACLHMFLCLRTFYRDLSKFSGVLFRLDGDEGVVGLSTHLTNLSRLMENCQDRYIRENAK